MGDAQNISDGTITIQSGSLAGTAMRYHELAVQRWLNKIFFVAEGYAVPVVFSAPCDAFSHFRQLWSDQNNPFSYLFDLKDKNGTPLYEPHPSPVRYPLIGVHRKGWKLRPYQNFSIHRMRRINWPTVSDTGDPVPGKSNVGTGLLKTDLGNVTTSRFPTAMDYRFQIDHFCLRPDTQSYFVQQLVEEFWRSGGSVMQTWIEVAYPGWGNKLVRLYIDGDIESLTPEEPEQDQNVQFRASFSIVVEGFSVDLRYKIYPAFWNLIIGSSSVDPTTLENAFTVLETLDSRIDNANPTLDSRTNTPEAGTGSRDLEQIGVPETLSVQAQAIESSASFGVPTLTSS